MKLIVQTSGQFQLVDDYQRIPAYRPAVVEETHFIQRFMATDRIQLLHKVSNDATDQELVDYIADAGDVELAVSAFADKFALEPPVPKKAPAKKAD
jgi:hypothetical protein